MSEHEATTDTPTSPDTPTTPDTSWIDDQVGYLLRRASAAMAADFAAGDPPPLRPAQISMLSVVAANPGIGQTELGAALGIQRTNTAPLVADLVERGLVDRRPSASDGRKVEIRLTRDGASALDAGRAYIAVHEARMTRRLDDDERNTLRQLLRRMIA